MLFFFKTPPAGYVVDANPNNLVKVEAVRAYVDPDGASVEEVVVSGHFVHEVIDIDEDRPIEGDDGNTEVGYSLRMTVIAKFKRGRRSTVVELAANDIAGCLAHPHISDYGSVCLGNEATRIQEMADHGSVIPIMMEVRELFSRASKEDAWGGRWPSSGYTCDSCGREYNPENEGVLIHNSGENVCDRCADDTFSCYDCGDTFWSDSNVYIEDLGDCVCESCRDAGDYYFHESDCGWYTYPEEDDE